MTYRTFTLAQAALGLCTSALLLAGCANAIKDEIPVVHPGDAAAVAADGGKTMGFGNVDSGPASDGAIFRDAQPSLDAFFIADPAPPMCAADGTMSSPATPGGTLECPDDKNREACPCKTPGEQRACWPGRRLNRSHGQCKDGVTTCLRSVEFGDVWGPCQGYVLPTEGAIEGPAACRCFSSAMWSIANLKPCIATVGGTTNIYSSHEVAGGADPVCESLPSSGAPAAAWTTSTLTADCVGFVTLCYTIKAGDLKNRLPTDCVVQKQCVDVDYETVGATVPLPAMPGWLGADVACNARFATEGGYGEMNVVGKTGECDTIDDGAGGPYVFFRTVYCKPGESCAAGGTGTFGN